MVKNFLNEKIVDATCSNWYFYSLLKTAFPGNTIILQATTIVRNHTMWNCYPENKKWFVIFGIAFMMLELWNMQNR